MMRVKQMEQLFKVSISLPPLLPRKRQIQGFQECAPHQENWHVLTILGKSAVFLTRAGDNRLATMIPIGFAENGNNNQSETSKVFLFCF